MIRNTVPAINSIPYGKKYALDYATNALMPYPDKNKIIKSRFSNNTTNFIHMYNKTIRTMTGVSFANNNRNMIGSKELVKKVNEINKILEGTNKKNT
tara:strand:+ start:2638 stop:2928 length:291 start_codon:yes stop_codon:yes gene_type:complete